MNNIIRMNEIDVSRKATVKSIDACGEIRRRLMDMGLVENTQIECVGKSPLGDPKAYLICGAVVAIRAADCRGITVEL